MHTRKHYVALTPAEQQKFVAALIAVKRAGVVDRFAEIHSRHFAMGIHHSSHFLPWHREFILRFERELQKKDASIALPYWDSTVDRSASNPLWSQSFLGRFNAAWRLHRSLGAADHLPTPQTVQSTQAIGAYKDYWPRLEVDVHNHPHVWVGGVMAGAASPGDPVFFLHHAYIDMLYARWRTENPHAAFVASGPGLGLHDPMMEWPDRTPADVLDHRALGYQYDSELVIA